MTLSALTLPYFKPRPLTLPVYVVTSIVEVLFFLIPTCYFNFWGSIFLETIIANIMEISKYTWAETPTQITEQKKTLKSKPVWGMLLTKSNQNSSRILDAVHKQASPFWPIKFYIFFPVGNFVFNIPYISLMLWLKAKTAAV